MDRREFLKSSAAYILASGGVLSLPSLLRAAPSPVGGPIVVNIVLDGGADFRHWFVPPVAGDYGAAYWKARALSHGVSANAIAYQTRYTTAYDEVAGVGGKFGIIKKAGWLKSMYDAGNVAIINSTIGSKDRNHSHSLLVLESGDLKTGEHDFDRDGWGGRLAKAVGGNVISMTPQVRRFCNGPHTTNALSHDNRIVVSAADSRDFGLYSYEHNLSKTDYKYSQQAIMSRALSGYYAAKRPHIPESSPYYKFMMHEQTLRAFGDQINGRLKNTPQPTSIAALMDSKSTTKLVNSGFAKQIRNLYDTLSCADLLQMRVASLDYGGWDSHKKQIDSVEPKISDIFGTGKGLDTLMKELTANFSGIADNLVFVISSEFGRQLAANGDNGTDHGTGSCMLVIGKRVKGGIYGEQFPTSEITRFDKPNTDIAGKTSIERVISAVCGCYGGVVSDMVVPYAKSSMLESGVDLSGLVRA